MRPYKSLFEAKQVGVLYHFTRLGSLEKILQENILYMSRQWKNISFTRNKNLISNSNYLKENKAFARIVVDGDKLSNDYKIRPFVFPQRSKWETASYNLERPGSEAEEMVEADIKDIKKYIIRVDLPHKYLTDQFEDVRGISDSEETEEDFKKQIESYDVKVEWYDPL